MELTEVEQIKKDIAYVNWFDEVAGTKTLTTAEIKGVVDAQNRLKKSTTLLLSSHDSLITTIESQVSDIEKWKKEALANHPTQWAYDQACAALNKKTEIVESQKEEIADLQGQLSETKDWETDAYAWRDFCESRNNLDEKDFTEDNFTMLYQELEELKTNSKFQIESQNVVIEEYQFWIENIGKPAQELIESQKEEIASLKAITELAVKGLKSLIFDPYPRTFHEVEKIVMTTLSEIERLQNG